MSPTHFFRRPAALTAISCALLFTVLSVGAGTLSAKEDAPTRLLNAELPHGTTLEKASCTETVFATRQAVKKNPSMAVPLMQRAINSRVSPVDRDRDFKDSGVSCECLTRIVQAAVESAPANKVHELIEVAMASQPQCAKEITDLTKKPRIDGKDAPRVADNGRNSRPPGSDFGDGLIVGDPGLGFGEPGTGVNIGFPGSPGFIGSAPSGGNALFPPVVLNPVTSIVNP